MYRVLILALVAVFAAVAVAETRPKFPEVFTTTTDLTLTLHHEHHRVVHGKGIWGVDQPKGKQLDKFDILETSHRHLNVYRLDRFDMHHTYEIVNNGTCHEHTDEGTMPPVWGWVEYAAYEGQHAVDGHTYAMWGFQMGYAKMSVAVSAATPNQPSYLFVNSTERHMAVKFVSWNTEPQKPEFFVVPSVCHKAEAPGCVSRGTMISRAQVWVDHHVPYNQGGHYDGYREDCSGYVSMAWELGKPGLTTFTLPHVSHPISKGSLQPGDVLLCTTEHVVLFGGWTSGAKTHYTAFEETRPGEGTVKRVTPYPYWYNTGCFKPYRSNGVC